MNRPTSTTLAAPALSLLVTGLADVVRVRQVDGHLGATDLHPALRAPLHAVTASTVIAAIVRPYGRIPGVAVVAHRLSTRLCLVHGDSPAVHVVPVEVVDGLLGQRVVGEFDESEPA
jgi:hypothetical protein